MSTDNSNWSCTEKCRSSQHAKEICAIATKGDDKDVVNMWESTCRNYATLKDKFGRTALHMAASTKNSKVVDWLVRKEKSMINAKDLTSGYTPLHRSIYFGQIQNARNLIAAGGSLTATDNEGLNAIDLCLADRLANLPVTKEFKLESDPSELYIWGTNDNFNLGTDNQTARKIPEPLDRFRPKRTANSCVMLVYLQTFHSLFLGQSGGAFVCGVGNSGRLGLGEKETVVLVPRRVPLKERCIQLAAGTDHSIFLLHNGIVKTCGSNENYVLGHQGDPFPETVFYPRTIDTLSPITISGVRASSTHSVFYRQNRLYTCGINLGQLGHFMNPEPHVIAPRLVNCVGCSGDKKDDSDRHHFSHVECNDFATVVRNHKGIINILYRNECRRLAAQQLAIVKIVVTGGQSFCLSGPEQVLTTPLCLLLLTKTGSLVIWREDISVENQKPTIQTVSSSSGVAVGNFTQVIFDMERTLTLKDIAVSRNSMLAVTMGGEAFMARWSASSVPNISPNRNSPEERLKREKKSDNVVSNRDMAAALWTQKIERKGKTRWKGTKEVVGLSLEHMKLKRVPNIHAGESVSCDPKGNNYAIIQRYHKLDFVEIPMSLPSTMNADLERLFKEVHLDDILHDVVFNVENSLTSNSRRSFPAHRFIVASFCPQLFCLVKEAYTKTTEELPVSVSISGTEPFIFEQILKFIYIGTCDLLNIGGCVTVGSNLIDPITCIRLALTFARQLKLEPLAKKLNCIEIIDGIVRVKKGSHSHAFTPESRKTCDRANHSSLTDVTILSSDNFSTSAHRCILVARMDYFNRMMLGGVWRESTTREIALSVKNKTVDVILDFLYEEKVSKLTDLDVESIREVFMATDLFGLDELRANVEVTLAETIHHKNAAELLSQAIIYNANQLRDSCFNFISLNLAQLLENRLLDGLDSDIMAQLSQYYINYHPFMRNRQLQVDNLVTADDTYFTAEPYLEFENFLHSYEVFEEEEFEIKSIKLKPRKVRNRTRTLSSDGESNSLINVSNTSTPPKTKPVISLVSPSSSVEFPSSAPFKESNMRPNQQPGKPRNNVNIKGPEKNIYNSFHFPSLSSLIAQPDHFQLVPSSPPFKTSGIALGAGKKKTKWRSLINENLESPATKSRSVPISVTSSGGRDPTNPWQKYKPRPEELSTSPVVDLTLMDGAKGAAFKEILKEEQEMKDNLIKATEKPLRLMQIEELAMQQLALRYRDEDIIDQNKILTIERVCSSKYASPTWPHKAGKMTSPSSFRKL